MFVPNQARRVLEAFPMVGSNSPWGGEPNGRGEGHRALPKSSRGLVTPHTAFPIDDKGWAGLCCSLSSILEQGTSAQPL